MLSCKLVENSVSHWQKNNKSQCSYAEKTQRLAEVAIDEAEQAGLECVERAAVGKRKVNHHLEDRIDDLQFRFSELDLQKKKLEDELTELHSVHKRVEEAQSKCREPLHITKTCIARRYTLNLQFIKQTIQPFFYFSEERVRVEIVQDPVNRNLVLEEIKIVETEMKLTALTRELNEQIRLLRAAIYSINKDTTGKESALGIDKHCARLTDLSSCLQDELELNNRKFDRKHFL
jgi:tektin-1